MSPTGHMTAQSYVGSAQSKASDAQSKPIPLNATKMQPVFRKGCPMKLVVAVLTGLFGATSALAADLPARTYTKAPVGG